MKEILAKIAKGEALTDAEKETVAKFDLQHELDAAASGARKKAEEAKKKSDDALAALQAEFDTFKAENDPSKGQSELAKLQKRIEKLEADKKAAEDKATAMERSGRIRALAKDAGINPAKGVDSKTIDLLVDNLMKDVDLEDADAVKAAFDGFKTANAGLIAAGTVGGVGTKGKPGGTFTGANPFSKKTFNVTEQLKLKINDPEKAAQLEQQASHEG